MCLQYKAFENTVGKGEIARNEQFLLFLQCFLPVWRTFCHFHQSQNCRLQSLTVWKSLKSVVWERVKSWISFQSKGKKPLFVQFVLESIWSVYESVMVKRDKDMMEKIVKSLNLKIAPRDSRHNDPRVQLQAVMGQWLPVSQSVLGKFCTLSLSQNKNS